MKQFIFTLCTIAYAVVNMCGQVATKNTESPTDTIVVSIANKKTVNGFLEFDIMVRGSHMRGNKGNYLSSLEVELDYNAQMFSKNLANGTPTGGKIVATNGADFDQKTKTGKKWEDSYTVRIQNATDSRIRLSLLMNYYKGAHHFRGLIDETPRPAIHIKLPVENCLQTSSNLHFVENGTITVGTYVPAIDAGFGGSIRYMRHRFIDGNSKGDVNCQH